MSSYKSWLVRTRVTCVCTIDDCKKSGNTFVCDFSSVTQKGLLGGCTVCCCDRVTWYLWSHCIASCKNALDNVAAQEACAWIGVLMAYVHLTAPKIGTCRGDGNFVCGGGSSNRGDNCRNSSRHGKKENTDRECTSNGWCKRKRINDGSGQNTYWLTAPLLGVGATKGSSSSVSDSTRSWTR